MTARPRRGSGVRVREDYIYHAVTNFDQRTINPTTAYNKEKKTQFVPGYRTFGNGRSSACQLLINPFYINHQYNTACIASQRKRTRHVFYKRGRINVPRGKECMVTLRVGTVIDCLLDFVVNGDDISVCGVTGHGYKSATWDELCETRKKSL